MNSTPMCANKAFTLAHRNLLPWLSRPKSRTYRPWRSHSKPVARRTFSTATLHTTHAWHPVASAGDVPAARSSHSVTSLSDGAVFAVFGGEDSPRHAFDAFVHLYSAESATWRPCGDAAPSPAPLLGHAAASVGSVLYIFGGRTGGTTCFDQEGEQMSETETATLLSLDTAAESPTWCLCVQGDGPCVQGESPWPSARSFHSMAALGSKLFIFGGCGEEGRLNDLWCLDTASSEPAWVCLSAGDDTEQGPAARGGSSLVALPKTMYSPARLLLLFGFNGQQMGDLWTFDLPSSTKWDDGDLANTKWVDRTLEQVGDVPSARSVAAVTAVGDKVFVFGGEAVPSDAGHEGAGAFTNDAFVLNPLTMTWCAVAHGDTAPPARGWAGAAQIKGENGHAVAVWGGLDSTNTRACDGWVRDP